MCWRKSLRTRQTNRLSWVVDRKENRRDETGWERERESRERKEENCEEEERRKGKNKTEEAGNQTILEHWNYAQGSIER
jgi:hypothetical protein